jgi:hypothetical protein
MNSTRLAPHSSSSRIQNPQISQCNHVPVDVRVISRYLPRQHFISTTPCRSNPSASNIGNNVRFSSNYCCPRRLIIIPPIHVHIRNIEHDGLRILQSKDYPCDVDGNHNARKDPCASSWSRNKGISDAVPYDIRHRKDSECKHICKRERAINGHKSSSCSVRETHCGRSCDVRHRVRRIVPVVIMGRVVENKPNPSTGEVTIHRGHFRLFRFPLVWKRQVLRPVSAAARHRFPFDFLPLHCAIRNTLLAHTTSLPTSIQA